MAQKKYLDLTGLQKFAASLLGKFALKNHDHDTAYAAKSHTHTTAQVSGLDSALAGKASTSHNHSGVYAPVSHNHSAENITSGTLPIARGGTGTTSANGIRSAIGINPVTTGGTGAAYTASVNGITSLTAGVEFMMVPHTVSTTVSPTLNVNGLGAKSIRRRVSNSTVTTVAASSSNWLGANKPIKVVYDGTFWIADFDRPNATDIYGTISSSQIASDTITLDKLASDVGTVAVQSSEPFDSNIKIWIQTD